jgi:hemolysin activation/secretion protein
MSWGFATRHASIAISLLASAAAAQDMHSTGPRLPEPSPPATIPQPALSTSGHAAELLLPALKGLILVDSQDRIGTPPDPAQAITNAVAFLQGRPELLGDLNRRIGLPLTTADLDQIVSRVVSECRVIGRPVVDVFVPEQDVTDGYVRIVVIEGLLGAVRVEGATRTDPARLISRIRQKPGEPIRTQPLLEDLDWMNQNPFRDVQVAFRKGTLPQTTDLVLHVDETVPFRLYGGYENNGTSSTGKDRLLTGFNAAGLLTDDDQLNYQFTGSPTISQFEAHGASYVVPLPWRDIVTLSGTWSTSRPQDSDPNLASQGVSWEVDGNYRIPLPPTLSLRQYVQLGATFKRTNNDLEFGGTQIFSDYADIVQFNAGYDVQRVDSLGLTSVDATVVFSPGDLGAKNNDQSFDAFRGGANAQYLYLRGVIDRQTTLPKDLQLVTRLTGQFADGPLLPSEQLSVGGFDTVRGYPAQIANGDAGLIFTNELRSPAIHPLGLLGMQVQDSLVLVAFLDIGVTRNRDAGAAAVSNAALIGAGPGLRYTVGSNLTMQCGYGFAVSNHNVETGDGEPYFSLIGSFTW